MSATALKLAALTMHLMMVSNCFLCPTCSMNPSLYSTRPSNTENSKVTVLPELSVTSTGSSRMRR
ncbi:hypothetical protein PR001_g18723 [Phytophthora rubi]|uniref:RxLR effector protein n=1 Tax=Phytophthora rubi TaxID=129364 RepID=A0A6A3K3E3_9STRA|nr:hypothetical protein PR001_g18723 [Phytophthora rubi]